MRWIVTPLTTPLTTPQKKPSEKQFFQQFVNQFCLLFFVLLYGCNLYAAEQVLANSSQQLSEQVSKKASEQDIGLRGKWCYVKKRKINQYTIQGDKLYMRGGRSGRTHEAAIHCNETYTQCEAQTVRGWGTPVTETLVLDGENMILTRIWGGAWKDKTYTFKYSRCPKW